LLIFYCPCNGVEQRTVSVGNAEVLLMRLPTVGPGGTWRCSMRGSVVLASTHLCRKGNSGLKSEKSFKNHPCLKVLLIKVIEYNFIKQ